MHYTFTIVLASHIQRRSFWKMVHITVLSPEHMLRIRWTRSEVPCIKRNHLQLVGRVA